MSTTTRKRYIMHNQKCYACGKPQGTSFLGYDPKTLKSYCLRNCRNPEAIPEDVELVPMNNDDLLAAIQQNYTGATEELMVSLLGKTASVRLQPAHIMHLMKVAELEGYDKTQATLVNIIENDMKERNLDHIQLADQVDPATYVPKPKRKQEPEEVEEVEEVEEQAAPVKIKTEKKTVQIKEKDPEPEVEDNGEEDEDDFSF